MDNVDKIAREPEADADLVDIRYLLWLWLKWIWVILILGAVGAYMGIRDARNFVPVYRASMVVMPDSGAVQISEAASQLSSAFGVNVGGSSGESKTFDRLRVMVGSVDLAEDLQERYGLLQIVYKTSWDDATQSWIQPDLEAYNDGYSFRRWFDLWTPPWHEPDVEALAKYLSGSLSFDKKSGTQFYEVSVEHSDPEMALFLLTTVYDAADDALRTQDRMESRERRRAIHRQLADANLIDARQALIGLLTSEERRAILLESDLPYAARVIDTPFVSNKPKDLNMIRTIGFPAIFGLVLGFVLVSLVGLLRR
jgi:hypothetical protein